MDLRGQQDPDHPGAARRRAVGPVGRAAALVFARARWLALISVLAATAGNTALIISTGGLPNPYVNLYYIVLALGAFYLPPSWAVATALPVSFLTSQVAVIFGIDSKGADMGQHVVRGAGPPVVAFVVSYLAAELRQRVAQEERGRRALEAANAELTRANKRLDEFTYSVSHDLKEPLRTVEAFSQFLAQDYGDRLDEQGRGHLDRIVKASARMKSMIDSVLAISRLRRLEPGRSLLDSKSLVEGVLDSLRGSLEARCAQVKIATTLPPVLADQAGLEAVFGNLISNAIKFNDKSEPRIEIGAYRRDGDAAFFVRDNGIGVAAEGRERIFHLFQRLHPRDQYEGTGAGLAICKAAVELMGGDIWLESEPGEGTTFYFTVPIRKAATVTDQAPVPQAAAAGVMERVPQA